MCDGTGSGKVQEFARTGGHSAPTATQNVRPCHSIHCRHYDLADGMVCEVEFARRQAAETRKAVAEC
jgi:hypothetical protein